MKKLVRFFEIDLQYLSITTLPFSEKIRNVLITDLTIFRNLFFSKSSFPPINISGNMISYDTRYATKSFLVGAYDLYNESKRFSIFDNNAVVVDIGSNIGQYLFALKTSVPQARVYSVEADPIIFKLLKKNASNLNKVKIFQKILSNKSGSMNFYTSKKFSTWSTLVKPEDDDAYTKTKVEVVDGDSLFEDLKHVDLLKIDVEGAEWEVLMGLKKTLKKSKYILIEISITRDRVDPGSSKIVQFLLKNGFHIHHIGRIFTNGVGMDQSAGNFLFKSNSEK